MLHPGELCRDPQLCLLTGEACDEPDHTGPLLLGCGGRGGHLSQARLLVGVEHRDCPLRVPRQGAELHDQDPLMAAVLTY